MAQQSGGTSGGTKSARIAGTLAFTVLATVHSLAANPPLFKNPTLAVGFFLVNPFCATAHDFA
jgi:hypothetical protein